VQLVARGIVGIEKASREQPACGRQAQLLALRLSGQAGVQACLRTT
jgi:hypothetical protein